VTTITQMQLFNALTPFPGKYFILKFSFDLVQPSATAILNSGILHWTGIFHKYTISVYHASRLPTLGNTQVSSVGNNVYIYILHRYYILYICVWMYLQIIRICIDTSSNKYIIYECVCKYIVLFNYHRIDWAIYVQYI